MVPKALARMIVVVMFFVVATQISFAQISAIGVTQGDTTINGRIAPTGTTVLSGDMVVTTQGPAVVNLVDGGQIEIAETTATFSKNEADVVVVGLLEGKVRFNFMPNEKVRFDTDCYDFYTNGVYRSVGRLEQHGGNIAARMVEGQLIYDTGVAQTMVTPDSGIRVKKQNAECRIAGFLPSGTMATLAGAGVGAGIGIGVAMTGGDTDEGFIMGADSDTGAGLCSGLSGCCCCCCCCCDDDKSPSLRSKC